MRTKKVITRNWFTSMDGYGADEAYAKQLGIPYIRPESGVEKAEREAWERRHENELQNQPSNSELIKEIRELKELLKGSSVDIVKNSPSLDNVEKENNTPKNPSRFANILVETNCYKEFIDIQPKGY